MKYSIIILIALFNLQLGISQSFAIVKDQDGYSNIRNGEGVVIDRLITDTPVFCFGYDENDEGWVSIDYSRGGILESGSIHKSRLVYIFKYTEIPVSKKEDESIILSNESIKISLEKEKFTPKNYYLTYDKDKNLIQINNNHIWGADGNIPQEQYKAITISINSQKVFFPKSAFENTFSPNLSNTQAFYDKEENRLYLSTLNGDGAGGYVVLWVFKNGIYEDRLITNGF